MRNLFILELKRFRVILLIFMVTLLSFSLINSNIYNQITYQNEQLFIEITFVFMLILSIVIFIRDYYIDNQYLYAKRTLSNQKIYFIKIFIILFNGLFVLLVGSFMINIKALIFKISNPILYRILDIPKYPFVVIGKLWFEWIIPMNFVLNIFIYAFVIMMIFLKFRYYSSFYKEKGILSTLLESSISIVLVHIIIRSLLYLLELLLPFLNLNSYNYKPILENYHPIIMINPFFIPTIFIYGFLIYSNIKKMSEHHVRQDYYDATRNIYFNLEERLNNKGSR